MTERGTFDYQAFGLRIRADFELPELPPAADERPPDLRIRSGPLVNGIVDSTATTVLWRTNKSVFELRIDTVANYLMEHGTDVQVEWAEGADPEEVRLYLLGSVIAAVLHERETLAFHASAVAGPAGAYLFLGKSGAGKSTALAALHERGLRMISDDVCAIDFGADGVPIIHPAFPRSRVCRDVVAELGWREEELQPVIGTDAKLVVPLSRFDTQPVPVRGFFSLETHLADEIKFEPLQGSEMLPALVRWTYRKGILKGLEKKEAQFRKVNQLARAITGTRLLRPSGFGRFNEMMDQLAACIENDAPDMKG